MKAPDRTGQVWEDDASPRRRRVCLVLGPPKQRPNETWAKHPVASLDDGRLGWAPEGPAGAWEDDPSWRRLA